MTKRIVGMIRESEKTESSERTRIDNGKKLIDIESKEKEGNSNTHNEVGTLTGVRGIPLFDMRLRKLELPIFKREVSEGPDGWLHCVERYFIVNQLMKRDKLEAAVLCLEDAALSWHR